MEEALKALSSLISGRKRADGINWEEDFQKIYGFLEVRHHLLQQQQPRRRQQPEGDREVTVLESC